MNEQKKKEFISLTSHNAYSSKVPVARLLKHIENYIFHIIYIITFLFTIFIEQIFKTVVTGALYLKQNH